MSVSGISSSSFYDYNQTVQNQQQQFRQEFQQLGQDLQSGNLSAAQSDFATLTGSQTSATSSSSTSSTSSTSSSQSNSPIAQAFNQLSQDLQSGNLSAAQQDYANIQQDFQSQATQGHHHHHHHHSSGDSGDSGNSSSSTSGTDSISQLLNQLGQDLQSGNLTTAQQTYSTLQQDFQQFTQNSAWVSSAQSSTGVSVSA